MTYTYDYPRPMVTTDVLLFSGKGDERKILLIKRGQEPFQGMWAFPGGFLNMDEELIECARRELKEETGIEGVELKELCTVGTIGRDPRGRMITVMFTAEVNEEELTPEAGDDAASVAWFRLAELPELAFDHRKILNKFS